MSKMSKEHKRKISESVKKTWADKKKMQEAELQLHKEAEQIVARMNGFENDGVALSNTINDGLVGKKKKNGPIVSLASNKDLAHREFVSLTPELIRYLRDSAQYGDLRDISDFFDTMLDQDPGLSGLVNKRKNAISSKVMKVVPASSSPKDIQVAAFVDTVIKGIDDLDRSLRFLNLGLFTGFSCEEIYYEKKSFDDALFGGTGDGYITAIVPSELQPILNRRFRIEEVEGRWRYLLDDYGQQPLDETNPLLTNPEKFILHSPGEEILFYKRGMLRKLFWAYFLKKCGIMYYAAGSEKHAFPNIYGQVPNGTEEGARRALLQTIKVMANDGVGVFDEDVTLKILEGNAKDGAEVMRGFIQMVDTTMTKFILQGTLVVEAASGPGGNRALGEVHERSFEEVVTGDAYALSETLKKRLIKPILELNSHLFGGEVPSLPSIEFKLKLREPEKISQIHLQAQAVTINELRESLGLDAEEWGNERAKFLTVEVVDEDKVDASNEESDNEGNGNEIIEENI